MWCDVIDIGRREREIVPPPRLRFSPLEIFAQRQLQPVLARIFPKACGLALAFVIAILHRRPARMRRCSNNIRGKWADGRKSCTGAFAATDPGRLASLCGVWRSRPAGLPALGTYCVSLPLRAIADSGAARDLAGADDGG